MIARITLFSESGTVFSYLSDFSNYYGDEDLPVTWTDGEDVPNVVVDVLETITQSDDVPPFMFKEEVTKVMIEPESDKHWITKHAR